MRRFSNLLIFLLLLVSGLAVAGPDQQPPDSLLIQADRMLSYKAYGRAIDLYTQLLSNPKLAAVQRSSAQSSLAQAYRAVGDNVKAERMFREWQAGLTPGQESPAMVLLYAKTLASNGKFKEAQDQFDRYELLNEKQRSRRLAPVPTSASGGAAGARGEAVRYQIEDLNLNTANEEFSPMYYLDGLVYVAGSKGGSTIEASGSGGGSGYLDLVYVPNRSLLTAKRRINADGEVVDVKKKPAAKASSGTVLGRDQYTAPTANDSRTATTFEGGINVAQGLGYAKKTVNADRQFSQSLNTKYHEGPATFTADGSQIIFTRNNYNNGKAKTSEENVNTLKLYTARQINGAWANVTELPFNSDDYAVGHPALCKGRDGTPDQLLFFVSNMPGGIGGTDLYVSRWVNNRWSEPVNLGPSINTKGNELFPFADENGNLYFSSDGRRGLGGLDVFYAAMDGTVVKTVETIDAPINSNADDFGLITDGSRLTGYFSSNRSGSDDVFRFTRESSLFGCRDLTVRVFDVTTDAPIDSVMVTAKGKRVGQADQVLMGDKNGFVRLCLDAESDYIFTAARDGYVSSTVGLSTRALTDDQPLRLEMALAKPTLVIDTIYTEAVKPKRPLVNSRIRGVVLGERDGSPIEGVIMKLKNDCNGKTQSAVTDAAGTYEFDIVEGCDYTLTASKPMYGTSTSKVKRVEKKSTPKELVAMVRMWHVGDVITIDNIYYDLGNSTIRPDAARELNKMVATMRRYPTLVIEIRSHTDSRGDAGANKELSTRRARAVADYLASKGISRKRMLATGYGESMLVNNCTDGVICTENEHQRNRRTEFKVLAIK
ncbi:OmpA family protein [Fibrivirga algicola]|uniref:OmpA family protein n=1 Tax=Fibrivirga algicola TaxID=2950420 RepID=A0ABX0QDU0_9BACT|nr:OmpA family protein [Fibrivirga algicola]NID10555.1 OmpA family protein [Fibrivirga algicola]